MSKKFPTTPAANEPQGPDQALLQAIADLPAEAGPPAHLDAAILKAAEQAVRARPLARIRPWLSVAAAVFVAFFAANLLQLDSPSDSVNQLQTQSEASADRQQSEDSDDRANSPSAGATDAFVPANQLNSERTELDVETRTREPAGKARTEAPTAPKPAAIRSDVATPQAKLSLEDRPDPFPAETRARSALAEQASTDRSARLRDRPGEERELSVPMQAAPAAAASAPVAAAAPMSKPGAAPAKESKLESDSGAALGRTIAVPESSTAPAATGLPPSSPALGRSKSKLGLDSSLSPTVWINRIRQLFDAGDDQGAKAALAEFRQAYPQAEIPDDLQALESR